MVWRCGDCATESATEILRRSVLLPLLPPCSQLQLRKPIKQGLWEKIAAGGSQPSEHMTEMLRYFLKK